MIMVTSAIERMEAAKVKTGAMKAAVKRAIAAPTAEAASGNRPEERWQRRRRRG